MRYLVFLVVLASVACNAPAHKEPITAGAVGVEDYPFRKYVAFTLQTDEALSENELAVIEILIDVADIMDRLFWAQAYGDKEALLTSLQDSMLRAYASTNYGPWDRLNNNMPFLASVGKKARGAGFYPADITVEEFENWSDSTKQSGYTMIRRDEAGQLTSRWYHEFFAEEVQLAANGLERAARLTKDPEFARYLRLRAQALRTDQYMESDMAWLDMKSNHLDFVVGPIETYEDALLGIKTSYEAYVLVKDRSWSRRLSKYAAMLPGLQQGLPVPEAYKRLLPGTESDLNAYDVLYYAGDCNAGSKTIAINLPNDERVQEAKGTRRLQLKNAMRAKYDKILLPLADELIVPEQRQKITFDAFFGNTMFHEVAHGLGIKYVIGHPDVTVKDTLKELASAMEEGKADVLGLYMIMKLHEAGEIEGELEEYFVTFMASIFRSVRFGASSAHGKANMLRFNFMMDMGAFERTEQGQYRLVPDKFVQAVNDLSKLILTVQGDGDYTRAASLLSSLGVVKDQLREDLDRCEAKGIPVDVVFRQGMEYIRK